MQSFNADQLSTILADLLLSPLPPEVVVAAISSDTRTLADGDTFVAVAGERFDGHKFVDNAVSKGAKAVMLEQRQAIDVPQIVVSDTRLALGRLAAAIRDDFVAGGGVVIGVTGSVGKTTNKQMLASICSQVDKTHATAGNLNNELGVPFTWFALPQSARYAVIEMGASSCGEIDYLATITRPQVAIITNAGAAHLEGFGGLDGVAKGKGELFANLTTGDTAVINADDAYADYWRGLLAGGVVVKTFALDNNAADVFATDVDESGKFTLNAGGKSAVVRLPVGGLHNVVNALGCAACALALGVDLSAIVAGLESFESAKGRLQTLRLGELTVIDDSYNANPMSMHVSANILAGNNGYKIMVLGDMSELGDNARQMHAELGRDLQGKADIFLCLGENMAAFAENNERAKHFADIGALNTALTALLVRQPNATVLVKGSRSMHMENVVELLTGEYQ